MSSSSALAGVFRTFTMLGGGCVELIVANAAMHCLRCDNLWPSWSLASPSSAASIFNRSCISRNSVLQFCRFLQRLWPVCSSHCYLSSWSCDMVGRVMGCSADANPKTTSGYCPVRLPYWGRLESKKDKRATGDQYLQIFPARGAPAKHTSQRRPISIARRGEGEGKRPSNHAS